MIENFVFSTQLTQISRAIPPSKSIVVSTVDCTKEVYVRLNGDRGLIPIPSGTIFHLVYPDSGIVVSQIEVKGTSGDTVTFMVS